MISLSKRHSLEYLQILQDVENDKELQEVVCKIVWTNFRSDLNVWVDVECVFFRQLNALFEKNNSFDCMHCRAIWTIIST